MSIEPHAASPASVTHSIESSSNRFSKSRNLVYEKAYAFTTLPELPEKMRGRKSSAPSVDPHLQATVESIIRRYLLADEPMHGSPVARLAIHDTRVERRSSAVPPEFGSNPEERAARRIYDLRVAAWARPTEPKVPRVTKADDGSQWLRRVAPLRDVVQTVKIRSRVRAGSAEISAKRSWKLSVDFILGNAMTRKHQAELLRAVALGIQVARLRKDIRECDSIIGSKTKRKRLGVSEPEVQAMRDAIRAEAYRLNGERTRAVHGAEYAEALTLFDVGMGSADSRAYILGEMTA